MTTCPHVLKNVLLQRPSGDVIEQAKQRIQEIQVTLDSAADEERRRKEEERKKCSGILLGGLLSRGSFSAIQLALEKKYTLR